MMNLSTVKPFSRPVTGQQNQKKLEPLHLLFAARRKTQTDAPKTPAQKVAVYAGSFDPLTNGHLWLIQTGAKFFDKLIVALGINPDKRSTFSDQERIEMLKESTKDLPNVEIALMRNEFLVDFAKKNKANALIRGVRDTKDLEYEKTLAHYNRKSAPDIQTVFFMAPKEIEDISSSLVRGLVGPAGWRKWTAPLVPAIVQNGLKTFFLKQRWNKLADKLGVEPKLAQETFKAILAKYSESSRVYHNKDHIIDLLEVFDEAMTSPDGPKPQFPEMLELAIWFHDFEDERGNAIAVDQSAAQATAFIQNSKTASPEQIAMLSANIMATKHLTTPPTDPALDSQMMVDIDLSILGKSPEEYTAYTQAIRAEYPTVSDADFKKRRVEVMKMFHARTSLYQTPWFQEKYGAQARVNLKKEIRALSR